MDRATSRLSGGDIGGMTLTTIKIGGMAATGGIGGITSTTSYLGHGGITGGGAGITGTGGGAGPISGCRPQI